FRVPQLSGAPPSSFLNAEFQIPPSWIFPSFLTTPFLCTLELVPPFSMTSVPQEIVSAHSPDSDDAFMFYGLATRKVRSALVNFRHVLEDIESLNRKAMEGRYELSAISYHAYPYVADKYVLMSAGSS